MRLLSTVAELGSAAVPEIAGRLGMDVRDVAARLAALSTTGLPLTINVECDQQGLRNAVAQAQAWTALPPNVAGSQWHPGGQHPSGWYAADNQVYPGVQNQPSGPQPGPPQPGAAPPGSAPHPVGGTPSGGYGGPPSGPQPAPPNRPSGGYPAPPPGPNDPQPPGPPQAAPRPVPPGQQGAPDAMRTWGPPAGSADWARGDQPAPPTPPAQPGTSAPSGTPPSAPPDASSEPRTRPAINPRQGTVGSGLDVAGPGGERLTIRLVEVVDPADFLLSAAGFELPAGERAVVVHTELTNRSTANFDAVPDQHLMLVANDGSTVSKSSISLASRPPFGSEVRPGTTTGGHTVYLLPESTELVAVRWSPTPDDTWWSLTWDITDL